MQMPSRSPRSRAKTRTTDYRLILNKWLTLHRNEPDAARVRKRRDETKRHSLSVMSYVLSGARQNRRHVQHRDDGHRCAGDQHAGERRQVSRGAIHPERGQRHTSGGQLGHQRALPLRYDLSSTYFNLCFCKSGRCMDRRPKRTATAFSSSSKVTLFDLCVCAHCT